MRLDLFRVHHVSSIPDTRIGPIHSKKAVIRYVFKFIIVYIQSKNHWPDRLFRRSCRISSRTQSLHLPLNTSCRIEPCPNTPPLMAPELSCLGCLKSFETRKRLHTHEAICKTKKLFQLDILLTNKSLSKARRKRRKTGSLSRHGSLVKSIQQSRASRSPSLQPLP